MLQLSNVQVSLAGSRVLRGIDMGLVPGRTTVLVGRNGAGKTTTLRAIMGLLPVDGGRIALHDQDLADFPAYRRVNLGIGYAPEDRRLIGDFSVEENLLIPADALKLSAESRRNRLNAVYELLPEVRDMRTRSGGGLSGGQGKMVALARALMAATSVILLDEPFQGLAPALALEYARILSRVREQRKELALLITESSPDLLDQVADETLHIERGEIAAQ